MVQIASLAMRIDSREVDTGVRRLDDLSRAGAKAENQAQRLTAQTGRLAAETRSATAATDVFKTTLTGLGVAAAAHELGRLADSYTTYTNQLKVAGLEGNRLRGTQESLFGIAQKYGTQLESIGTLYGRLSQSSKDLNAKQSDLLKFTDLVGASLKVQGRSASESTGSLLQLSQLMGGSKVQAEEYNSLIDGMRPLLMAVASGSDRWRGSVSRLTADVRASKVTVKEFYEDALKGANVVQGMAAKANFTLANSFTVLDNAVGKYVGETNEQLAATQQMSKAIIGFSQHLDAVVPIAAAAVAYLGVRWVAAGAEFAATETGKALAAARTTAALADQARAASLAAAANARLAASGGAATVSAARFAQGATGLAVAGQSARGVLGGLVTFLGGPWGIGLTVAAGAVWILVRGLQELNKPTRDVEVSTNAMKAATKAYEESAYDAATASGKEREEALKNAAAKKAQAEETIKAAQAKLADAQATLVQIDAEAQRQMAMAGNPTLTNPEAPGAPYIALGARQSRAQANVDALRAGIAEQQKAINAAQHVLDAGTSSAPAATGKADKHAQSLARELEAMRATAAATLDLARAYGVSDAAALKAQARADAVGHAIQRQGDIAKFVSAKLAEEAAQAAADGAKQAADLSYETAARKILNDQVAAGLIDAEQANNLLQQELALRPLAAAAAATTGKESAAAAKAKADLAAANRAANDELLREQAIRERRSLGDDIELLQRQLDLVAATNRERAVELAGLEEAQRLGKGANTDEGKKAIEDAKRRAGLQEDLRIKQDAYNASLHFTVDLLSQIDEHARQAAEGLSDAFGSAGRALGELMTTMTGYAKLQAQIAEERAQYIKDGGNDAKRLAMFDRDAAQAEIKNLGDMTKAAKGFFDEKSVGYQVLSTAEKAFRAIEAAGMIKSMAMDIWHTVQSSKNSAVRAAAHGVEAIAKAIASLPFPLNLAAGAATAAALVAVGVRVAGAVGGGGAVPGENDAKDRQAAQGAGSVLGDASAKSESIAKALEAAAANTNKDLEYSNQMVRHLRSIDDQIGTLTAALAKTLSAGGALDTSGLGLGTSSGPNGIARLFGGLVGGLLSSKTTTRTLQDQGLSFGPQSLGAILGGGLTGSTYQQVLEQTTKKFLGITYSNKTSQSTLTGGLDGDLSAEFTRIIGSLKDTVLAAAGQLGLTGAEAVLQSFVVNLGTISLKDLKGDEIKQALSAVFGKLGDQMAAAVLGDVAKFQKAGEGALETLVRVARQYQVLDVAMQSIGRTFGAVGVASLEARERLVDLAGGIDDLVDQTASFADAFLTEAERMAPVQAAVSAEMARLGLSGITTKAAFKQLVLGIDVTSQQGAELYAALLKVAPAFAKVADFAEEAGDATVKAAQATKDAADARLEAANKAVDDARAVLQRAYDAAMGPAQKALDAAQTRVTNARNALTQSYQRESQILRDTAERFRQLGDSLRSFGKDLAGGDLAALSPEAQLAARRATFSGAQARLMSGDTSAYNDFQSAAQALLEASEAFSPTSLAYQRDRTLVLQATAAAAAFADTQVSAADQQLDALNNVLDGVDGVVDGVAHLGDLTLVLKDGVFQTADNVVSVANAISELQAATVAAADAQAVVNAINDQVGSLLNVQQAVLTIPEAIDRLKAAMSEQAAAQLAADQANGALTAAVAQSAADAAAQAAAAAAAAAAALAQINAGNDNNPAPGPSTPAELTQSQRAQAYLARYSDVAAEYADESTRDAKSQAYLASLGIRSAEDFAIWHYNTYGQKEGRQFKDGGDFTVGGAGGTDSKFVGFWATPGETVSVRTPGQASNDALVAEIRALRDEVVRLRADQNAGHQAIAANTGETASLNRRWENDGIPETRSVA